MSDGEPLVTSVRERLLEAAEAVLDEVGETRLTLAQVVRRAGLTTGAVYSNFENREELIVAVFARDFEGYLREGVDRLRGVIESDLVGEEYAEAVFELLVRPDAPQNREARWLRLRALAAAQRYERVREALESFQQSITIDLIDAFAVAKERGRLDPDDDPRSLALLAQILGFGLVLSDLSGDLAPDPDAWIGQLRRLFTPVFISAQDRSTSPR